MTTEVNLSNVDVSTPDGTADAYLAVPTGGGPHPGVLMFMDALGLRAQIADMARRLSGNGYVVLVPNVFYRAGRAPVVDIPDLTTQHERDAYFAKLMPLMGSLTADALHKDFVAYLGYIESHDAVSDGPIGTHGYCMGGALALRAAAQAPQRIAAAASFHGGRLATDQPDSPHLLAARWHAEIYIAHAYNDPSMPPEQQKRLDDALDEAGVTSRTEVYTGAAHGFTMADMPVYDRAAAERHWAALLDLYGRTLGV
jgi:carboxymethylenebutenolidase